MPFTLSHPAAVLPLARSLPLAALVIGSMSPDLEYPLRLAAVSRFSHTLPAVVYFCIPAGMLCLLLYRHLLEAPLQMLLPRGLWSGTEDRAEGLSRALLPSVVALGTGALSHIAWDSFTHEYGWMVRNFPFLGTVVFTMGGYPAKLFSILQHASSAAGLIILIRVAGRRIAAASGPVPAGPPGLAPAARRGVSAGLLSAAALAAVWNGSTSSSGLTGFIAVRTFAAQAAIAWMMAIAAGILVYAVLFRIVRVTRGRR